MPASTIVNPAELLALEGLSLKNEVHYQCAPDDLVRATLRMGEGVLSDTGALVIRTGQFTGRSPKDKFIVKDEITAGTVNWNDFNLPIVPDILRSSKRKSLNI